MSNYNTTLQTNNSSLEEIITQLNNMPDAGEGGVELPTLSNPAGAADILASKEAIDGDGNKITGTIATKTSSDLTASGATVTIPAGYYASQASKSIASGSAKTPATTVTKNPTISVDSSGLITASVSGTQNVTPTISAGYVSSGTAGTITVSGSATKQLTTEAAKTITPTESSQTAVASGRYTTGAITVDAIPDGYLAAAEVAEQDDIIAQIQTALQGKTAGGSGSSSVPTCRIFVTIADPITSLLSIDRYVATTFENNSYGQLYSLDASAERVTAISLNNVVCGSAIWIFSTAAIPAYTVEGGVTFISTGGYGSVFQAPLEEGAFATIDIADNS